MTSSYIAPVFVSTKITMATRKEVKVHKWCITQYPGHSEDAPSTSRDMGCGSMPLLLALVQSAASPSISRFVAF